MEFISLFGTPKKKEPTVLEKIRDAVQKTQENFTERIQDLVEGKKEIDPSMLEELEAIMIGADVGVTTTSEVLKSIRDQVSRKTLQNPAELRTAIKQELRRILNIIDTAPRQVAEGDPFVILMVGVNGVGKTTTIGKLANRFKSDGKSVLLCAADTFRAAAIEQLEIWATRSNVPIVKQKSGADPSAVLFDALQSAKAKKIDYVIVDTAGRLHTKHNLMSELEKMTRVAKREVPGAARSSARPRRHHGAERIGAGEGVRKERRHHRPRPHQAGRHGEGRRGDCHCQGIENPDPFCRRRRKDGRSRGILAGGLRRILVCGMKKGNREFGMRISDVGFRT